MVVLVVVVTTVVVVVVVQESALCQTGVAAKLCAVCHVSFQSKGPV